MSSISLTRDQTLVIVRLVTDPQIFDIEEVNSLGRIQVTYRTVNPMQPDKYDQRHRVTLGPTGFVMAHGIDRL
jgi:hypothetical protein